MDRETKILTLIYAGIIGLVLIMTVAIPFVTGSISCYNQAQALGYKYDYKTFGGCFVVLQDGRSIPIQNLKVVVP